MKNAEIKELSTAELIERRDAEATSYKMLVLNHAISPIANPSEITKQRKTIARMNTEIRKRELNK